MSGVRAGSARSVLLSVLGELVEPLGRPVWTASLLHVMRGVGFEDQAARQAIDRAAEAGWIESNRFGRNVRWELTVRGKELIARGAERVHSLAGSGDGWAGEWLTLLITVPADRRQVRRRLYAALSWAGFGNPTPGLWLSPHPDRRSEAETIVAEAGLRDTTFAFVGPSAAIGLDDDAIVGRAWDLDAVAASYEEMLPTFAPGRTPAPGDELLFAHVALVNEGQRLPFLDPQLPGELLGDWVGHRAIRLFEERRAEWAPSAHARWAEVMALTAPPGGDW
jgi:phenylacetic acid degradation operon negative regulatory protein